MSHDVNPARHRRRHVHLTAAFAALLCLVVHLLTLRQMPLTDDDDAYVPAAISYAHWGLAVVRAEPGAWSQARIDAAFDVNHEHPPLAKAVMGVAILVLDDGLHITDAHTAARIGIVVVASSLMAGVVLLAHAATGSVLLGFFAALMLLCLPRFFVHSAVPTLDVAVATMVVWAVWSWHRAEHSRTAAFGCGVVFALACLTKLNAPFVLLPCLLHALLVNSDIRRTDSAPVWRERMPRQLLWMLVLAPILFVILWPHLWYDTIHRFGRYLAFHLHHYPILFLWDGTIYHEQHAPWTAPVRLAFAAMPLPIGALGVVGVVRAAACTRRLWQQGRLADAADSTRVLLLLQTLFALGIVAFLPVPKYGGEKLFMPFFPLWCILAADGIGGITTITQRTGLSRVLAAFVVLCSVAPGVHFMATHGPGFGLSYFGASEGGLRGAVARGHERTYYDLADPALAEHLVELAGGKPLRVCFEPNPKEYIRTYRWLERIGHIPPGRLLVQRQCGAADVVVLTHERRWSSLGQKASELQANERLWERRIDGVPLWTVFRRSTPG